MNWLDEGATVALTPRTDGSARVARYPSLGSHAAPKRIVAEVTTATPATRKGFR